MAFLSGNKKEGIGTAPTYRHLLSPQAMTVFNPLRVIAHCDIDAAYAQFEQVRLDLPDHLPLICAQWQSIIAVNYPARKFGIKRFNTIDEAKKMCPELIVQHVATYRNGEEEAGYWGEVDPRTHKVSLDPYRRESLKILAIFKEMVPKGEIEKASIDEAFLDLTQMSIDRLLIRYPYLSTVPEDAPDGLDSPLPEPPHIDWTAAGNVFPIGGEKSIENDGEPSEEGLGRKEEAQGGWEDWALCVGAEIMGELRAEVWKRLHYTCSAGIAHNKAMAKLCSAWKKPNNQTILRTSATPAFLRDMDFTDIRFLGGKLGNAIATEYNAKTVGDMLTISLEELQRRFGEESIWVYNILRGIDHTEVTPRVATKSMLASKNTRPAVTTPEQGLHWINVLAGELNVRLRESREIAPGLWPKTLVLGTRTGAETGRHRQIPFPFTKNLSTEYIVRYAKRLWDEVCQPLKNGGSMKLNNMSLSFTGLDRMEEGQQGIEGFFGSGQAKQAGSSKNGERANTPSATTTENGANFSRKRSRSPDQSHIANKTSGSDITAAVMKKTRLPILHSGAKRKTGLETFLVKNGESSKSSLIPEPQVSASSSNDIFQVDDDPEVIDVNENDDPNGAENVDGKWQCPQCNTLFAEPDALGRSLQDQKNEHNDYHFALALQDDDDSYGTGRLWGKKGNPNRSKWVDKPPEDKVKKKPIVKKEGIKAFFTPKNSTEKK